MSKKNYPGLFIAVEGLDGSGSSLQASLLANVLSKDGYRVYLTKEPTTNLIGGLIRAQLTGEWRSSLLCLQLLFAADRAQHLNEEILPNLQAGKIVITDRYIPSTIAYGSLEIDDVKWLENINSKFIKPDVTFLVKMRPKLCAMRIKTSQQAMELFKEEKKLIQVWKIYEKLAQNDSSIKIVDGERDEMEIVADIKNITEKLLGLNKE
ncbi:MAG: dTMP kinase [Patescibacteria group bacterium]|nr:dTMP kinase [Patescibacteria group bacterium]